VGKAFGYDKNEKREFNCTKIVFFYFISKRTRLSEGKKKMIRLKKCETRS